MRNLYDTKVNNQQITALGGCDDLSETGKDVLRKRVKQACDESKMWRDAADRASNPLIRERYLELAELVESAL